MNSWAGRDDRLEPYGGTNARSRAREVREGRDRPADRVGNRPPGLSVVILTLDRPDLTVPLVRFLDGEARPAFAEREAGLEVVVGDTGSSDPELLAFYDDLPKSVRVVRGLDYHFGRCNNRLFADHARFDTALFLNNDVSFPDGPAPLLGMWDALRGEGGEGGPGRGVAGHVLHYPDGRVQHAGIDFQRWGSRPSLPHHPGTGERWPPAAFDRISRVPAVSGACLMIGAALFRRCGGFDPGFEVEWQDVDLCLRAHRLGETAVLASAGEAVHLENATRPAGEEHEPDRRRFARRWSAYVTTRFPRPVQA